MTRMDSTWIGKNFVYMARTLKERPAEEFVDAAKAVLEHHFDNHQYCGAWCMRKNESPEQQQRIIKYYRSMTKDPKLYKLLNDKISRFITFDKLQDMAHGMDTNMNEAFNQICTWFCPKNKVFAGSGSLHNRIAFAVGINSLGYNEFFTRIMTKLGITVTNNLRHYLKVKENSRAMRLKKIRTKEAKLDKTKSKREKLKADTRIAKAEYLKRQGTYRKGMNLDDPYGEGKEDDNRKPPARPRPPSALGKYCEYCGLKGHATKKSKKCSVSLNEMASSMRKFEGGEKRSVVQARLYRIFEYLAIVL
jgi:hypothetical protein